MFVCVSGACTAPPSSPRPPAPRHTHAQPRPNTTRACSMLHPASHAGRGILWKSLVVGRAVASARSTDAGRRSPSPTRRHPTEAGRRATPAWPRAPKPSRWDDQLPRGAPRAPRPAPRAQSSARPRRESHGATRDPEPMRQAPCGAPPQLRAPNPSRPNDRRPRGRPPRPGVASGPRRARPQSAPAPAAPMHDACVVTFVTNCDKSVTNAPLFVTFLDSMSHSGLEKSFF